MEILVEHLAHDDDSLETSLQSWSDAGAPLDSPWGGVMGQMALALETDTCASLLDEAGITHENPTAYCAAFHAELVKLHANASFPDGPEEDASKDQGAEKETYGFALFNTPLHLGRYTIPGWQGLALGGVLIALGALVGLLSDAIGTAVFMLGALTAGVTAVLIMGVNQDDEKEGTRLVKLPWRR